MYYSKEHLAKIEKIVKEKSKDIIADYEAKMSNKAIKAKYGITDYVLYKILDRAGIRRRYHLTDDEKRVIASSYKKGESIKNIVCDSKRDASTIYYHIHKMARPNRRAAFLEVPFEDEEIAVDREMELQ